MTRIVFALPFCLLSGFAQTERPPIDRPPIKRISIAGRLRILPRDPVVAGSSQRSFGSPASTFDYETSGTSGALGGGAGIEIRLAHRLTLGIDALLHGGGYTQGTTITDSSSNVSTVRETTRAQLWDFPIRVQSHDWKLAKRIPRMFFSAGGVVRHAANVRTEREWIYSGGSSAYDEIRSPVRRNSYGASLGGGIRLVDDFGFQFVPEIRYTRLFGETFRHDGGSVRRNQIEILLSVVF